jgi:hypothetical protein
MRFRSVGWRRLFDEGTSHTADWNCVFLLEALWREAHGCKIRLTASLLRFVAATVRSMTGLAAGWWVLE